MKKIPLRLVVAVVSILFLALLLDIFLHHQLMLRHKNDQILSVSLKAATIRARLEKQIASNLYIIQGLGNYVSLNPLLSKDDFDQYSQEMLYSSTMIRNVAAAPDYVIEYIYPLKGNESVVGLDYRKVPSQWNQVRMAESTGKMVVAGPVELVQGGKAFIGSVPVYVRNDVIKKFWGIVSAVIDADLLFETAGIYDVPGLHLAIRGVDGKGADGAVFFGNPDLFFPEKKAVLMPVAVSSGAWQMAVVPAAGWGGVPPNSILIHAFLLLLVLSVSFAAYKIIYKNIEVEEAGIKLSEAQSIARLGNWSLDLLSKEIWWSDETYRIFGVEKGIYKPSQNGFFKHVHPEDRRIVSNAYLDSMKSKEPYILDHRIVRPDGEIRYVTEQGRIEYDEHGNPVRSIGTIMDITERKLIENELLESKIRFDHVTKKLSNKFIFFSHTIYGEFISLSEGFEMLGYGPPEKGIGRRWTDVIDIDPDSLALAMEFNEKVISGESENAEYELSFVTPDGTERSMAVFGYMAFNYERDEYIYEGVAIDITDRKLRNKHLKILSRAIENAPVSVVVADTEGTINYVNPYFSIETGYSRAEAIGANPRVLKSGEHDDAFYKDMWDTIISGETWRGEIINKKKDGSLYWESASISPVYNAKNDIVSYVAVKEDISDKKELERLKGDVELIMRHDLKTPLNGIIGLPGLLLMDENLTDEQIHLIKVIEDSGKNMLHMIDMSLDMFKMETGKYEYHPRQVDILSIARQVISHSGSKLSARKISVELFINEESVSDDSRLIVWGEERLIYSLFSGLLTNAIEASPLGGPVSIKFAESDPAVIVVSNKGVVPQQIRDSFFEKYVTVGKSSGTGLGTYSARLMAETMGYDIRMEAFDSKDETCIIITTSPESPEQDY